MSFRLPHDPESRALFDRYVVWTTDRPGDQRYLRLMGINALRGDEPDHDVFMSALAEDARQISDADLAVLLELEWRARITAAWLIGLDRRDRFRQALGELLLVSELVYAGQGYCFALARFGQRDDAGILVAYLDRYLSRKDCEYDQDWAIGALLHLDHKLGTDHAQRFLVPDGAWHQSAFADKDPLSYQRTTDEVCAIVDRLMDDGR
jgi:hypothetical protein